MTYLYDIYLLFYSIVSKGEEVRSSQEEEWQEEEEEEEEGE